MVKSPSHLNSLSFLLWLATVPDAAAAFFAVLPPAPPPPLIFSFAITSARYATHRQLVAGQDAAQSPPVSCRMKRYVSNCAEEADQAGRDKDEVQG